MAKRRAPMARNVTNEVRLQWMHPNGFPLALRLGRKSFAWVVLLQGVGAAAVKMFGLKGSGLTPTALAILVPLWLLALFSLGCLLTAWLTNPRAAKVLPPHHRPFGLMTRALASFLFLLFIPGMVVLGMQASDLGEAMACYWFLIMSVLGLFLCTVYHPNKHPLMWTALLVITPVGVFLLAPLIWPVWLALGLVGWLNKGQPSDSTLKQRQSL